MPSEFTIEASSEFGINIRHGEEGHLYLFGIGEDETGAKTFTSTSCRAYSKAKHPAEFFEAHARQFAESAARGLGLLDEGPAVIAGAQTSLPPAQCNADDLPSSHASPPAILFE